MLIAGVKGFKILHLPARRMRSYDQLFGKLLVKDQTMGYSDSVEDTTASTSELDPQYEIEMQERGGAYAHQVTSSDPHDEVILIGKHSWTFFRRRGLKVLAAVASLILLVLLVSIPIQKRKQREQDLTNVSSDTPMGPPSDNSTAVPNPMDASGSLDDELLDEVNLTRVVFAPISTLDPVVDLGILGVDRPVQSRPSSRMDPLKTDNVKQALPTNAWYQNLLLLRDDQSPTNQNRAYTMPYVVDVTGGIPGLRLHDSFVDTSADQVIVSTIEAEAVTLGAARNFSDVGSSKPSSDQGYSVEAATDLGITLQWSYHNMTSSLVRGMPYGTMIYNRFSTGSILPTIHAEQSLTSQLLLDRASRSTGCVEGSVFEVRQDIEMRFAGGRTWLAFLSVPANVQCIQSIDGPFMLQVVDTLEPLGDRPLVLRLAAVLVDNADGDIGQNYKELLRKHANVFPGESTRVHFEIDKDDAALLFDWDPTPMNGDKKAEIIAFAMPHHQDKLSQVLDFCVGVLLGSVCLVEGSTWVMTENLPTISFEAATSLDHGMLPDLVQAVTQDLRYRVPSNFLIGAGDTYFSGKALGKLARILLITHEVLDTCYGMIQFEDQSSIGEAIGAACNESALPSTGEMDDALSHLRQAVEIWLNGTAQAPLLYDKEWGGIVSCGCDYKFGSCRNVFPDCPGLTDQGLNFGAGFYNDHHFHYGYHIYAAATVAHFDRDWGRENFERILMLVRDIANPSADDFYFPTTRHKDWYHGSSWASGISQPPSPTGMNQESSSEAIAGYESVSLFGKVMSNIFSNDGDVVKAERADSVLKLGRLLAATELRSAKRYWHVLQADGSKAIFDTTKYKHNVVGILWSSKVFFGTWFGNSPYLIYGIQLLPLTTISEDRDDMYWVREMFDTYAQSCGGPCIAEGWSVQILALLATLGHREKALKHAKELTDAVFDSPGGNGHSLSNTIWYISTRPEPSEPYNLTHSYPWEEGPQRLSCSSPKSCTDEVLASMAGQYACGSRISYLMNQQMKSEYDACHQIAAIEFPDVCGGCNPDGAESSENNSTFLEEDLFDGEEDIFSELETATSTPRGLTCNQPSTCTADMLRSLAGTYPCGDRIHWLMTTKGMSEEDACAVIAVQEFPDICGGCNPGGS